MRKIWTADMTQTLVNNYATKGRRACARLLGMSDGSVNTKAARLGLKVASTVRSINCSRSATSAWAGRKLWTPDMLATVSRYYNAKGAQYCADKLGLTARQVTGCANKLGLDVSAARLSYIQSERTSHMWRTMGHTLRGVDADYFINCKTKESAYILGLLWADGYTNNKSQSNKIELSLLATDFVDVVTAFDCAGKWSRYTRYRAGRRPATVTNTSNKPLYEYLVSKGYRTKSLGSPELILATVPDELKHYWWRGYFDGDGCFYFNEKEGLHQASFAGSYAQDWSAVESLLTKLGLRYRTSRRIDSTRGHKSSGVILSRAADIEVFGDYIYAGDIDPSIKRKYRRYVDLIGSLKTEKFINKVNEAYDKTANSTLHFGGQAIEGPRLSQTFCLDSGVREPELLACAREQVLKIDQSMVLCDSSIRRTILDAWAKNEAIKLDREITGGLSGKEPNANFDP